MADDHTLRPYRSNDQHRRATEPVASEQAGSNDPLAELARLIGQSDPFAEFGRSSSRRAAARQDVSTAPAEQWHEAAHDQQHVAGYDARVRDAYYRTDRDHAEPLAPGGEERDHGSRVYEEVPLAADHQGQYDDDHGRPHEVQQSSDLPQDGYEDEQYYQDDAPFDPREDEMYDDPPRARQRISLVTVLALVGCALLGTVGAYAYRSYSAPTASTQPPPVITADNSTPTKIIPATAGDPQSEKAVQDRLANAGKEQLVSKQEEPVVLQEPGPQPAPRVVPPAAAQQPSSEAATASTEPKKIRTVTIRPDASDISGRPVGLAAPTAPAAKAGTARAGGAPVSLDPQATESAAAASRTRTAAVPPAAARPAAEAPDTQSGGFVVQLSSQRSESEALASFRSLQAKFPNELSARQPIVRRVDLGSKGVFYRTMVGPFASLHQATQFCASYKAAGGQCVVPSN